MRTVSVVVIVHLAVACSDVEDPELSTVSSEMNGRLEYRGSGSDYMEPYMAATAERAMYYARTIATSEGYRQCVANTMSYAYMNCRDPILASRDDEIAEAWTRFRTRNNTLEFFENLNPDAHGNAGDQGSNTYGTHGIGLSYPYAPIGSGTNETDWSRDWQVSWGQLAATEIHEFLHTIGYAHFNVDDDPAELQGCADANGRASYYVLGEPSVNHIYGRECTHQVLGFRTLDYCISDVGCPTGEVYLPTTWTGISTTPQPAPRHCECVQDPRHIIALRTNTGRMVTATSGGGSTLSTSGTAGIGAWQWLYVYDESSPSWASNDLVYLKTFNGNTMRRMPDGTFVVDRVNPAPVQFELVTAPPLRNGSRVRLRQNSYYAYDDGTTLRSNTTAIDSRFEFTIVEPRRDHLIYLRSNHGTYVNASYPGTRWAWNKRTESELLAGSNATKAAAAFWVIDWNGGDLMDGDLISIEQFESNSYHYLSARDGDHTGQLRMNNEISTYERFIIDRLDTGAGPITENSEIALRSAHGTYVTAMPADYFDGQLRNYSTYIGSWQKFRFRFVSQFHFNGESFETSRPGWHEDL